MIVSKSICGAYALCANRLHLPPPPNALEGKGMKGSASPHLMQRERMVANLATWMAK